MTTTTPSDSLSKTWVYILPSNFAILREPFLVCLSSLKHLCLHQNAQSDTKSFCLIRTLWKKVCNWRWQFGFENWTFIWMFLSLLQVNGIFLQLKLRAFRWRPFLLFRKVRSSNRVISRFHTPRPGGSKPDWANPGLARILIWVL